MLVTIEDVEIKVGATNTTVKYRSAYVAKLKSDGAKGIEQVSVEYPASGFMFALIGLDGDGVRMDQALSLLVLPCPPFCPRGSYITLTEAESMFSST